MRLAKLTTAAAVAAIIAAVGAVPRPASAVAPPADGTYGTIKGKLVYGGDAPSPKDLIAVGKATKDPAICAAKDTVPYEKLVVDPKTKGVANAFVYIVKPKGKNPEAEKALVEKAPEVEFDQKNCRFLPHSVAMHKAQKIVFKSSDPVGHNVHYTGFSNTKNFIVPPGGKASEKMTVDSRPFKVVCDIHPWMEGWIMVFDHPFFAVTGPDGTFEIAGIPAGDQNFIVWQEGAGYVTDGAAKGKPVKVEAGKTTDVGAVKLEPAKFKP